MIAMAIFLPQITEFQSQHQRISAIVLIGFWPIVMVGFAVERFKYQ